MNWKNIDLNSPSECDLNLLDPYDFDTLLLEVSCNVREINPETVRKQAIESIKSKYTTAIEILEDNLQNITAHALKYRKLA